MRIVGVPAVAHREALLRETAGGGRVPTVHHHQWQAGDDWAPWGPLRPSWGAPVAREVALLLHDDADPEAGAMGLARLAWVAAGARYYWNVYGGSGHYSVTLHQEGRQIASWTGEATSPEHAKGLLGVHLGLLDRVEVLP